MKLGMVVRAAGAAALVVALAANGQQPPAAPEDQEIVVEGQRSRTDAIRDLVDTLPPVSSNGHISRFEESACPGVIGVAERQKAPMVARMRAVAAAARVPLAKPGCRVNVLLIITPDKRQLMDHLAKHYPDYYGDLPSKKIAKLAAAPGPTALWHLKNIVDADGTVLAASGGSDVLIQRTARSASRITSLAHPAFAGSILVVETRALEGLTTIQVADYAAMRTFSGADPARLDSPGARTILSALEAPMGAEVPVTLTEWDLAMLKSLYASDEDRFASGQRGEIQAGMKRELDRVSDGKPRR